MSHWPHYHDAERTLDLKLPGPTGERTVRIWCDDTHWTEESLQKLAEDILADERYHKMPRTLLLDEIAKLPHVNAVQVIKDYGAYQLGIVAYLVPFDKVKA